ncbi:LysM peptidoglycan-binding domain-containing protein [Paraburkholderia sp. A1RI-2L]|uniref:LysM peptidoglycan-binding domain-containing protein n=1 Tax=Paraburkholderia sp. A1RI-2L TaxID=3028367 RepID=UPI003B767FDB
MFVRATYDREKRAVHYFDEEGNETLYIGGSFAWRTTNPGNLTKPGGYIISSAIGYAQRTASSRVQFVIFPDRAAGQEAHRNLLKTVYRDSTIRGMLTSYAPPSENDTESYIGFVTRAAGVAPSDVVGLLPAEKIESVSIAMEKQEGWVPGVIKYLGKPVQVQVLDKLSQPFAGQTIQIKSGDFNLDVKTDQSGDLPCLYSGLLGQDVSIAYKREGEYEPIGQVSTISEANAFTFNAPYFLLPTRPRLHAKDESSRPRVHIVQSGETLTAIAGRYGATVDAMVALNKLTDANRIYASQHLKVPAQEASVKGQSGASRANAVASTGAIPAAASATSTASVQHSPASTSGVVHQHAPNGYPQTVVSSPNLEPSGAVWCSRFPGSAELNSLNDSFRPKASAFIKAMRDAGISVRINAAFRPIQRSYLMYHAFRIAKGIERPNQVPMRAGVHIDWVHRNTNGNMDLLQSVEAAKEMCRGYGLNIHSSNQMVGIPGSSRHNFGAAIDLNISGYTGKRIKDTTDAWVLLNSFEDLEHVGRQYGVIYFQRENMHWSDNGH